MKVLAPAKVNLFLKIMNRRADGYHELETIFHTINLFDVLEIFETKQKNSSIELKVFSETGLLDPCPQDERNIVWKAARIFLDSFNLNKSCRIVLKKQIPVQAGLGGGSSDAASTLKVLSRLFLRNKNEENTKMIGSIARQLGADVPFFLHGGCAYAAGIGDQMTPLPPPPKFWAVLVKPAVGLSTKEVYKWFDEANNSDRSSLTCHSNINTIKSLIANGKKAREWGPFLYNSFEKIVYKRVPMLAGIKARLAELGADNVLLSGSGSSMFGIVSSKQIGEKVKHKMQKEVQSVWLVHSE